MGAGTKRNWNAKAILFLLSKTAAHQRHVFSVVIKLNFHVALHKSINHVDFNIL
jgi:hypothetical protein